MSLFDIPSFVASKAANVARWRGIDWREVDRIEGDHGLDVVVFFKDGREPVTLKNYPGEGTFARAEVELHMASLTTAV